MTYLPLPRALLGGAIALALLPSAHAESSGFFENSKTSLLLRNYYFNRDYNDPGASKSKVEEWAQGAILKFNSGYTPGVLGFGLDGIAMLGIKLDSSRQTSGSDLLPVHADGHSADSYGRAGVAAKMRFSDTELFLGELMPDVPLLRYDDGRLLPQTFQGTMLVSRELPGLSLQGGQYTATSLRNSSNMQDLSACLLYTSPSPRDGLLSRMPSSA